jgi:Fic family protein
LKWKKQNDEASGAPIQDVQEVSNYVAALHHGLERLRGGFPLSLRLIREIHAVLLSKGRGSEKEPGEFRRSQNWIGGGTVCLPMRRTWRFLTRARSRWRRPRGDAD